MRIQSLDPAKRLWAVSDLLPAEMVAEIQAFDWAAAEHEPGNLQNRRQIRIIGSVERFDKAIIDLLPKINERLCTKFRTMFGHWWLDLQDFSCDMHTDGQLPNAMQVYWSSPDPGYGTGFYYYKTRDSLKHQFLSVPNTGYIMLNHREPDGSQPLQWHGMFRPVAPGMTRLSSYHIFEL